ncbi:hypothetical protein [Rossellomorea sp. LjRoot5]|uniref:hypothetical protein n=1 Tax=Rossellomorea sp. LjRoot5 TaxID=3342331 RepID=UPI003ED13E40
MSNALWKLEPGFIAAYTEDRELIKRIKRYKKNWSIMADYFRNGRLVGMQLKIPANERRQAERMLDVKLSK